jgi:hypothetical protein
VLNNFRNLNSLYRSLGARWLLFRVGYALRMRTGWIRRQNPRYRWQDRPLATWLQQGLAQAALSQILLRTSPRCREWRS